MLNADIGKKVFTDPAWDCRLISGLPICIPLIPGMEEAHVKTTKSLYFLYDQFLTRLYISAGSYGIRSVTRFFSLCSALPI